MKLVPNFNMQTYRYELFENVNTFTFIKKKSVFLFCKLRTIVFIYIYVNSYSNTK